VFNALGDYYVNDAFGCCHRNHMSITGFDSNGGKGKAFGYLIEKEVKCLEIIR
jgi:3-phosphoglycerate kinase